MKFVSLGKQRAHRRGKLDKPARAILEPTRSIAASRQIHTYTELRQQIHHDLRIQHPEWVQPNGESPMCDSYEARLMGLLKTLKSQPAKMFSSRQGERVCCSNREVQLTLF